MPRIRRSRSKHRIIHSPKIRSLATGCFVGDGAEDFEDFLLVTGKFAVNGGCPYFVSEGIEGSNGGCGSHTLLGFDGDGFVEAHEKVGLGFFGVVDEFKHCGFTAACSSPNH